MSFEVPIVNFLSEFGSYLNNYKKFKMEKENEINNPKYLTVLEMLRGKLNELVKK